MVHTPTSTTYLVELYAPRQDREQLRAEAKRIRAAVEALADSGLAVRYLHAVLVPGEETAFHVFEAERPDSIEHALRDAGLEAERISPAIAETPTGNGGPLRSGSRPSRNGMSELLSGGEQQ